MDKFRQYSPYRRRRRVVSMDRCVARSKITSRPTSTDQRMGCYRQRGWDLVCLTTRLTGNQAGVSRRPWIKWHVRMTSNSLLFACCYVLSPHHAGDNAQTYTYNNAEECTSYIVNVCETEVVLLTVDLDSEAVLRWRVVPRCWCRVGRGRLAVCCRLARSSRRRRQSCAAATRHSAAWSRWRACETGTGSCWTDDTCRGTRTALQPESPAGTDPSPAAIRTHPPDPTAPPCHNSPVLRSAATNHSFNQS